MLALLAMKWQPLLCLSSPLCLSLWTSVLISLTHAYHGDLCACVAEIIPAYVYPGRPEFSLSVLTFAFDDAMYQLAESLTAHMGCLDLVVPLC